MQVREVGEVVYCVGKEMRMLVPPGINGKEAVN